VENQTVTWQENYKIPMKLILVCSLASIFAFFLVEVMNPPGIIDLFQNNPGMIGSFLFGFYCFGSFLAQKMLGRSDTSKMCLKEKEIHEADLHKIRGLTILFFLLFGVSLAIDSFFDQPITGSKIKAVMLAAFGITMINAVIYASISAIRIKREQINHLRSVK